MIEYEGETVTGFSGNNVCSFVNKNWNCKSMLLDMSGYYPLGIHHIMWTSCIIQRMNDYTLQRQENCKIFLQEFYRLALLNKERQREKSSSILGALWTFAFLD